MANDALELMKQISLFRQLGEAELTLLWAMGQEVGLPAGYALETPAGEPPVLWVILEGRIDITFPSPRMQEGHSTLFGPEIWGASSLVPPFASPGRAVTGTPCRVLKLGAHEVRTLAERNPRLGMRIYEELATHFSQRFRGLIEQPLSTRRPATDD